jgi:tetratricopeptide (TPR) repeat protein
MDGYMDDKNSERKQSKEEVKAMLGEAVKRAKRQIIRGDVDSASRELKEVMDHITETQQVFHDSSIELLPAYITIAEAYVHKGGSQLKRGEKILIVAYWNLLKQTSEENKTGADQGVSERELEQYRASLHKAFGRLFTAQTRYQDAIKELAQGIYLECNEWGPESIQVCSSYFLLGSIFQKLERKEEASAFYQKIIEILGELKHEDGSEEEEDDFYFEEAKEFYLKHILLFFEVESLGLRTLSRQSATRPLPWSCSRLATSWSP